MTARLPTLLLAEDDRYLRRVLARAFTARECRVLEASTLAESRQHLAAGERPSLAVLDLRLPDGNGLDLLSELHERNPTIRSVVLTGWGSIPTALEAVRRGAVDFLAKPIEIDDVLRALGRLPAASFSTAASEASGVPTLDRVEWEHIQRVLASCDGNVSQAARLLGLHRRSLQRKLGKRPPPR